MRSMKRAFESILGKEIYVDSCCQVLGALGVAKLVKNNNTESVDYSNLVELDRFSIGDYEKESFVCDGCNRKCNLVRYNAIEKEESFVVGGRCGKY